MAKRGCCWSTTELLAALLLGVFILLVLIAALGVEQTIGDGQGHGGVGAAHDLLHRGRLMHSPSVTHRKYALSDLNSLEIRTRRP